MVIAGSLSEVLTAKWLVALGTLRGNPDAKRTTRDSTVMYGDKI
jgi:hypothetical protein